MNILKSIIANQGRLDERTLAELGREFPDAPVFLRWTDDTLTGHTAASAPAVIAQSAKPVREILFNNASLETLCDALGVFYVPELSL